MSDKYDAAIAYLTAHPNQIFEAWGHAREHEAGCLFRFCSHDCRARRTEHGPIGCLTMVANGSYVAETPELTAAIRADKSMPRDYSGLVQADLITVEHLPTFARWQRRLDAEIRGIHPEVRPASAEAAQTANYEAQEVASV